MQKIFYDIVRNVGYLDNKSIIGNGNAPTYTYSIFDGLKIQLINSNSTDASGNFNDFYTGLSGVGTACQGVIDNNCVHKFDGSLTSNTSGSINDIDVTMSDTPRQVGSISLHNGTSGETIYFNDYNAITNGYNFTTSDASYATSAVTLSGNYLAGSDVEVTETPLFKVSSGDISNIDTGEVSFDIDLENVVLQKYIEGDCSLNDVYFEFQIFNSSAKRIMVKHLNVNILNIMDDDGESAPAPENNYYDKTQVNALVNAKPDNFLDLPDTPATFVGQAGKSVVVNILENGLEFVGISGSSTESDINYLSGAIDDNVIDIISLSAAIDTPVTSAGIADDSIYNQHINLSAGIEYSKMEAEPDESTISISGDKLVVIDIPQNIKTEISNSTTFSSLSDTQFTSVNGSDVAVYDNATSAWINNSFNSLITDKLSKSQVEHVLTGEISTHTHDFNIDNGIRTPASELDNIDNEHVVVGYYDEDSITKPTDLQLLLHFSDSLSGNVITDKSSYNRSATLAGHGSSSIVSGGEFGYGYSLNDESFSFTSVIGFDTDYSMTLDMFFQSPSVVDTLPLYARADVIESVVEVGASTSQLQIHAHFDDGDANLTYDVSTYAGDANFHHILIQSDTDYLYIGFDGVLLDKYPRNNRPYKTSTGDIVIGKYLTDYATSVIDEVAMSTSERFTLDVANMLYTIPSEAHYVDQYYDISDSTGGGGDASQADINYLSGAIDDNNSDINDLSGDINYLSGDYEYGDTVDLVFIPTTGYTNIDATISGHLSGIANALVAASGTCSGGGSITGYTDADIDNLSGHIDTNTTDINNLSLTGDNIGINYSSLNYISDSSTISGNLKGIDNKLGGIEQWITIPTSSGAPGTKGQRAYGGNYIYDCVATNTWVRSTVTTSF